MKAMNRESTSFADNPQMFLFKKSHDFYVLATFF